MRFISNCVTIVCLCDCSVHFIKISYKSHWNLVFCLFQCFKNKLFFCGKIINNIALLIQSSKTVKIHMKLF